MRAFIQRQQSVIVTAVVVGAFVAFGPGVAQAAYDAVNSDKVDGRHAVGAATTASARAGKLVATNTYGRLPNDIIAKAPDAGKLDGVDSTGFLRDQPGSVDSQNLSYDANWPDVYGVVKIDGVDETLPRSSFFTDANVLRVPDLTTEDPNDHKPGVYCIAGLPVHPFTISASSNVSYGGPAFVSSTLGEAGECADIPDADVQVSVFVNAHVGLHPAYDATFNLQVWGVPTS